MKAAAPGHKLQNRDTKVLLVEITDFQSLCTCMFLQTLQPSAKNCG